MIFNDKNIGMANSLKKACGFISTDWATILSDDDELEKSFVEEFEIALKKTDKKLFFMGFKIIKDNIETIIDRASVKEEMDIKAIIRMQ